jgi:hypothetical protein
MLNKTKIALAAALVIGTASSALAGYVLPGSTDGVNPAYHPRWFPNYPGVNNAPSGNPYAFAACFDAAGRIYYPTSDSDCHAGYPSASSAYGFAPSATHHKHHSPR